MKKKGLSQRGLGSYVPALLNDSPFFKDIVPQEHDSVKRQMKKTTNVDDLDAVNRGDMETAQRMVDEAAMDAGKNYQDEQSMVKESQENAAETDDGKVMKQAKKQAKKQDVSEKGLSYNSLVALPDLVGTTIRTSQQVKLTPSGEIDDAWLCNQVFNQCETVKTNAALPTYYLYSNAIGKNVEILKPSLRHGYISSMSKKKPASSKEIQNARATLNLPNILRTAIVVNISEKHTNRDTPFAYVMVGVTCMENANGRKEYYAVRMIVQERKNGDPVLREANVLGRLSAVNAKKIDLPHPKVGSQGAVARKSGGQFEYSIAHLLDDVKSIFQDTFSKDI